MVLCTNHVGNRATLDILYKSNRPIPTDIGIHLVLRNSLVFDDNPHDKWLAIEKIKSICYFIQYTVEWLDMTIEHNTAQRSVFVIFYVQFSLPDIFHFSIEFTYDLYRISHPILYCICIRMIHYSNRVDIQAMECIDRICHRKILKKIENS